MECFFAELEALGVDADWQEVVENGAQPELSGILKRVSERATTESDKY